MLFRNYIHTYKKYIQFSITFTLLCIWIFSPVFLKWYRIYREKFSASGIIVTLDGSPLKTECAYRDEEKILIKFGQDHSTIIIFPQKKIVGYTGEEFIDSPIGCVLAFGTIEYTRIATKYTETDDITSEPVFGSNYVEYGVHDKKLRIQY